MLHHEWNARYLGENLEPIEAPKWRSEASYARWVRAYICGGHEDASFAANQHRRAVRRACRKALRNYLR